MAHDTHAATHHHTSMGLDSRKMAFWAFIGSECLLFGSLISTYLVYKGRSLVGPYPHEILNIPFTSFSTFDLLMSSLAMVLALAAVQRGDIPKIEITREGAIWYNPRSALKGAVGVLYPDVSKMTSFEARY